MVFSFQVSGADFSGPVVSILDGGTNEVLHNQRPESIRLSGIDCPEKGQTFGQKTKHAASDLAFGKDVTIQIHGHDKYQRTLGGVILPNGMNLNQELVKQGWCWWYRKYAPGDTALEGLERDTSEAKKGCGLIRSRCRRGCGGRKAVETNVFVVVQTRPGSQYQLSTLSRSTRPKAIRRGI
ncbi:MAG: thermonuclease family protein [Nitrospirota bacterium]